MSEEDAVAAVDDEPPLNADEETWLVDLGDCDVSRLERRCDQANDHALHLATPRNRLLGAQTLPVPLDRQQVVGREGLAARALALQNRVEVTLRAVALGA